MLQHHFIPQLDSPTVVISVLAAVLAAYVAIELGSRILRQSDQFPWRWVLATAIALGGGIWSTQTIGMLALRLPVPIQYDLVNLAIALLTAIFLSISGVWVAVNRANNASSFPARLKIASMIGGVAMVSAHYVGTTALRGAFIVQYDAKYAASSVIIAITAMYLGIVFAKRLANKSAEDASIFSRWVGAMSVGFLFAAMYYVGIYSIDFVSTSTMPTSFAAVGTPRLVIWVALLSGIILTMQLLTSSVTRRFEWHELQMAHEQALRMEAERAEQIMTQQAIALNKANQAKSEFLATMSHELRTPLNAISGYTELLLLEIQGPLTESQREDLIRIQSSQRHLLSLINEVLNFTKIGAGTMQYTFEDASINDIINDARVFVEPQIKTKNIQFRIIPAEDTEFSVYVDSEKLTQVFINLFSNAIKFTEPNGTISVGWARTGESLQISVTDNGIGIPKEKLPMIFEPFYQVNQSLTRKHQGVGLGLSISLNLARGMYGDISATSQESKGSTFTVRVPLSARHLTPEQWERHLARRAIRPVTPTIPEPMQLLSRYGEQFRN